MGRILIVKLYGRWNCKSFEQYLRRVQKEIQSEHVMAIIIDFCKVEIDKGVIKINKIKSLKSIFLRETKNFIIADNPMSTVLGMIYKESLKEQGVECQVFSYTETALEKLGVEFETQESNRVNYIIKQGDLSSFNQSYQEHDERLFSKSKDIAEGVVQDIFIKI